MPEIGLFPLGMVLLPTEQVPLHIFEPRYRELIGECLAHDVEFGLVFEGEDDELSEVGTRAAVTEVLQRFSDGRLDVVVEGRDRFRIVELTDGRSFQTAEVAPVEDDADDAGDADVERALELFARLVELTGSEVEDPDRSATQLSFAIGARFELSPHVKQELLQDTSERRRMARLCELLGAAAETIERRQQIAERAQTNGKVFPRPDQE